MERFTSTSYKSAMKLAKTKFKKSFKVINTREIEFSTNCKTHFINAISKHLGIN